VKDDVIGACKHGNNMLSCGLCEIERLRALPTAASEPIRPVWCEVCKRTHYAPWCDEQASPPPAAEACCCGMPNDRSVSHSANACVGETSGVGYLSNPAEAGRVVIHGRYDAASHCVLTSHGETLVVFDTDEGSLAPLDGKQVSVTIRERAD